MKVALVYDRLNKIGGAEIILQEFAKLYPHADWYTSVWDKKRAPFSQKWRVKTSFLNLLPWVKNNHEWIPFLMPFIFESFNFSDYDLVISIGSAEAKGIITGVKTHHLHYCLTPTRYLYSHKNEYLNNPIYRFVGNIMREWDLVAATRPDDMIAISEHVKKRIQKYYHRKAEVIYPPVNTARFSLHNLKPNTYNLKPDYYLVVSRLVPYKKIDLIIKAFSNLPDRKLIIVGSGSEMSSLRKMATKNVKMIGEVSDAKIIEYFEGCKAFIQMNEEDFGIAMCEAQAAGKPVIAYNAGGASEIVVQNKTGVLFNTLDSHCLVQSIETFERMTWSNDACIKNAARFDRLIWINQMNERIRDLCQTNQR